MKTTATGEPVLDEWRRVLGELIEAGLGAVDAGAAVERALRAEPLVLPPGGVDVLAVGKAAGAMFDGACRALPVGPRRSLVIVPPGMAATRGASAGGRFLEAAHPVPDASSVVAAEAALEMVREVPRDRDLLVLLSGGASSLMCAPVEGVSLDLKQRITRHLLRAGADISELNTVRKHLSRVKGGRLLGAFGGRRARVLLISDVPGDDPSLIGSGPLAPDPSTYAEAMQVLRRRCREHSGDLAPVMAHLARGTSGLVPETLAPEEPVSRRVRHQVVASVRMALDDMGALVRARGLPLVDLGGGLTGEACDVPARLAAACAPGPGPSVVIWGGETTVTVRGNGLGGRNQELALAAVAGLHLPGPWVLAAVGSDGIDGPTSAAGALADSGSAGRALARGLDPLDSLRRNDSHRFFESMGDLLVTGPTGTNVGDLVVFVRCG
jgi:hydroxypyruvate reductase